jgi:hypothetical protein
MNGVCLAHTVSDIDFEKARSEQLEREISKVRYLLLQSVTTLLPVCLATEYEKQRELQLFSRNRDKEKMIHDLERRIVQQLKNLREAEGIIGRNESRSLGLKISQMYERLEAIKKVTDAELLDTCWAFPHQLVDIPFPV